jgi:hypothetical protein
MFQPLSAILDLIEAAPPPSSENRRGYAENAGNAEIPSPTPITASRSFPALGRAVSDPAEAPLVCYACRGTEFWTGTGKVTCRRCHPPAPGAEVLASSSTRSGFAPDAPAASKLAGPDRGGVSGGGAA